MPIVFTTEAQAAHLEAARILTSSDGWRADAMALAAYDEPPTGDLEEDRLFMRAIVVFQNRDANGVDIHFAGGKPGWASRRLLSSLFRFAYNVKRHPIIRAPISERNVEAIVLAVKSGFRFDGRLRGGAADGSDAILLSMTRDECRWILPASRETPTLAPVE